MKLTNQQLDALVDKIYNIKESKTKDIYEAKVKELESDKKLIALAKKYESLYNQIPKSQWKDIRYNSSVTYKDFLDSMIKDKIKEPKTDYKSDIRSEILLASIDSTTLEELQNKLKIKI